MDDYILKMLSELPIHMDSIATTPASNHLFEVNNDPVLLDQATSDMFHTNVAKLLFLSKRARPDIQTAMAFLCTQVKAHSCSSKTDCISKFSIPKLSENSSFQLSNINNDDRNNYQVTSTFMKNQGNSLKNNMKFDELTFMLIRN